MKHTHSTIDVLAWLLADHPALHAAAEVDRHWVWLAIDLRGEEHRPAREAIKEMGFRFAKRGHLLPSGNLGNWGHSCQRPLPFKRRQSKSAPAKAEPELSDEDLLTALASL